jgi:hypothetical protein
VLLGKGDLEQLNERLAGRRNLEQVISRCSRYPDQRDSIRPNNTSPAAGGSSIRPGPARK